MNQNEEGYGQANLPKSFKDCDQREYKIELLPLDSHPAQNQQSANKKGAVYSSEDSVSEHYFVEEAKANKFRKEFLILLKAWPTKKLLLVKTVSKK